MKQSLSLIRAGRRIDAPGFRADNPAENRLWQAKTAEYRDFDRSGPAAENTAPAGRRALISQ
jgi:hypothetical protein